MIQANFTGLMAIRGILVLEIKLETSRVELEWYIATSSLRLSLPQHNCYGNIPGNTR